MNPLSALCPCQTKNSNFKLCARVNSSERRSSSVNFENRLTKSASGTVMFSVFSARNRQVGLFISKTEQDTVS